MSTTFHFLARLQEYLDGITVGSGTSTELQVDAVLIRIIEVEDVLFHLDSAVMMPERPAGKSSTDGGSSKGNQDQVSGLRALALALREFEIYASRGLLIAGHADTSGQTAYNFTVSGLRAQNVMHLLTGSRDNWAGVSASRHRIEDYQQIMAHYAKRKGWACDPGNLDNSWGTSTDAAVANFFERYNDSFAPPRGLSPLSDNMHARVKSDAGKRWPSEAWCAVYELYQEDLALELGGDETRLITARGRVHFVPGIKPYIACGESFPIDSADKKDYRSQANRRVELLFIEDGKLPEINCPARTQTVHIEDECPVWHSLVHDREYISPLDLMSVAYHIKLEYFDRILGAVQAVPQGIAFTAIDNMGAVVPCVTDFENGVHIAKVRDDAARTDLELRFATVNQWVYTADDKATPVIVTKTAAEVAALPLADRLKYYDLPVKWSWRNWRVRLGGGDGRVEKILKVDQALKPWGGAVTSPGAPMIFSLDDIVLARTDRSQAIADQNPGGAAIPLDANSRYALFYIDHATAETVGPDTRNLRRLTLHDQDAVETSFSQPRLQENLIGDPPPRTRLVYFCNGFYDVTNRRSVESDPGFSFADKHLLGSRLALLNDSDVHASRVVNASSGGVDIARGYALFPANSNIGHYEMHYLHEAEIFEGRPLSYLLLHWNCRLTRLAQNPSGVAVPQATPADVANHRRAGFKNAMARLNKPYLFESIVGPPRYVRHHFYYEAKNDTNGGPHLGTLNIVGNAPDPGAWMNTTDAQLRARDFQDDAGYFGSPDPDNSLADVDGGTYQVLTNSHEFSHAAGNPDDYLYDLQTVVGGVWRSWRGVPRIDQPFTAPGGPYTMDKLALMLRNRTPRLRYFWKYACWLHDESVAGGALQKFLAGNRFEITFAGTSHTHHYRLEDPYRNMALPGHQAVGHSGPSGRTFDLLLYKLGDEEYAHQIKPGVEMNGVLVVKPKIGVFFDPDHTGAALDLPTKTSWAQGLYNDFRAAADGKFWLEGSGSVRFEKVYLLIIPAFQENPSPTAAGGVDLNIVVRWSAGNALSAAGNVLTAEWNVDTSRIIRYTLGVDSNSGILAKTAFPTVLTWMASHAIGGVPYVARYV